MAPSLGRGVHNSPFRRLFYPVDLIRYPNHEAGTWIYELPIFSECPNLLLILMLWASRYESIRYNNGNNQSAMPMAQLGEVTSKMGA